MTGLDCVPFTCLRCSAIVVGFSVSLPVFISLCCQHIAHPFSPAASAAPAPATAAPRKRATQSAKPRAVSAAPASMGTGTAAAYSAAPRPPRQPAPAHRPATTAVRVAATGHSAASGAVRERVLEDVSASAQHGARSSSVPRGGSSSTKASYSAGASARPASRGSLGAPAGKTRARMCQVFRFLVRSVLLSSDLNFSKLRPRILIVCPMSQR